MDTISNEKNSTHIERPKVLTPKFGTMPKLLTALPERWVLWRYEWSGERWLKVPKQPNRRNASATNPATWRNFAEVKAAYENTSSYFDGVGIALGPAIFINNIARYIVGVDFDNCKSDGEFDSFVMDAARELNTYVEISPSGIGIRMFLLHDKPVETRKVYVDGRSREIYSDKRYLTVTGWGEGDVRYVA